MKRGDKLYCYRKFRRNLYCYEYIFNEGVYYKIIDINKKGNHISIKGDGVYDFYITDDIYDENGIFVDYYLWDYFYTIPDLRKMKINKLKQNGEKKNSKIFT